MKQITIIFEEEEDFYDALDEIKTSINSGFEKDMEITRENTEGATLIYKKQDVQR